MMSTLFRRPLFFSRLTAVALVLKLKLMAKKQEPPLKFDEELKPVEFNELYRTQRRYRNLSSVFVLILFLALLVFFGIRYYQRSRQPAPPPEDTPAGPNLWVPGIDYQPPSAEGD
jgi:hypothetical protein